MTNCVPYCTVWCLKIVTRVDVSWNGIFWDRSNCILGRCLFFKTYYHISLRSFPVVHKIGNVGILVFGINLIPWVTKVTILLLDIYFVLEKNLHKIFVCHNLTAFYTLSEWYLKMKTSCQFYLLRLWKWHFGFLFLSNTGNFFTPWHSYYSYPLLNVVLIPFVKLVNKAKPWLIEKNTYALSLNWLSLLYT